MMNDGEKLHQRPRKDCMYNAKELEQILLFKTTFIGASTIAEHILILRSQILPTIFNYWAVNGKEPIDQDESRAWDKVNRSSLEFQNFHKCRRN